MLLPIILTGVQAGALYALLALALVVVYKGTDVVNFAQGDFATVGIYVGLSLSGLGLPPLAVVPLSMVAVALLGVVVEYLVARPLLNSNHPRKILFVVIATLALQVVVQNLIRLIWGPDARFSPSYFSFPDFHAGPVALSGVGVGILAVSVVLLVLFLMLFKYTKVGAALRATSENPRAAQLMGINTRRMYSLAWAISGGIGAIAGILLAHMLAVLPEVGGHVLIKAFAAAVLGGFHSLGGAIVGAFLVGIAENLAGFYIDAGMKEITAFGVIIVILMVRPQGLFGRVVQKKV